MRISAQSKWIKACVPGEHVAFSRSSEIACQLVKRCLAYPGTPFFFSGVVCCLLLLPLPLPGEFVAERPRYGDCLAATLVAQEAHTAFLADLAIGFS